MKKKAVALALAGTMLFGVATGGTLAWLMDTTDTVTNTFTVGNVDIKLTETPYDVKNETYASASVEGQDNIYPAIPGATYKKDPVVTVVKNSEDCYLFVAFTYSSAAPKYLTYTSNLDAEVDSNGEEIWTKLHDTIDTTNNTVTEVWYQEVAKNTTQDQSWNLLADLANGLESGITLKINPDTVTNHNSDIVKALELEWKAYAVQMDNVADTNSNGSSVDEAWELVKKSNEEYPTTAAAESTGA